MVIICTAGAMAVLCVVGLLIWAGIEIAHALDGINVVQNNTNIDQNNTNIDDVISSFGVVAKNGLLLNIDYVKGDMNLVLAAPHGGYKMPKDVPNRDAGCFLNGACVYDHKCRPKNYTRCYATVEHDDLTRELTFLIGYEIQRIVGKTPHLVINNLARLKLDPNRERHEATFDEPYAVFAYHKYHGSIERAKATFDGPGLFLDIHGHGHPIQRTEFGYQVSGDDLDRGTLDPSNSSIRALASRVNISFDDLVRGPQSLGALLVKRGYRAVPSPDEPGPDGNPYFDGEYDIFVHGSSGRGDVDGIMAESAQAYRKPDTLRTYAKDFAGTIVEFMQLYYNLQVPRYSPIINAPTLNADDSAKTKPESNNDDSKSSKLKALSNSANSPVVNTKRNNLPVSTANESEEISDDMKSSGPKYNRFPVILSAGLFVTVISLGIIVGAIFWKRSQRTRPPGYTSLNGADYAFSVDSD